MSPPREGQAVDRSHVVGRSDTATAVGSGDVAVLATPRLLAWVEAATVAVVRDQLADGTTSVGNRVKLEHVAPSPVGVRVIVRAELVAVDGRRLEFAVEARHADGAVVARGRVTRAIVDRSRFVPG